MNTEYLVAPDYKQPEFVTLENYSEIQKIQQAFAPLAKMNVADQVFRQSEKDNYFIIRTYGEDNVHRAMKYGIWTSSSRKNERLSKAFKSNENTYLFFTEMNSTCFSGIARIVQDFDPKAHFKFWLSENKWFGSFKIEWLYIKDVPYSEFEELKQLQKLEGSEEAVKRVYELIDGTELTKENGSQMLNIYSKYDTNKSLFEAFNQLDELEKQSRKERIGNRDFDKKFNELTRAFEQMPNSFSLASYERRKMQSRQNQYMYNYQYMYNQYMQYYPQYGNQQQQQQQQQPYWSQNNGFYQKQPQDNGQYDEEQEEGQHFNNGGYRQKKQYNNSQQQYPHRDDAQLDHRFNTSHKKYRSNKNRRTQEEDSQQQQK